MPEAFLRALFEQTPNVIEGAEQRGQEREARLLAEEMARQQAADRRRQIELQAQRAAQESPDSRLEFERRKQELGLEGLRDELELRSEFGAEGLDPLQQGRLNALSEEQRQLEARRIVSSVLNTVEQALGLDPYDGEFGSSRVRALLQEQTPPELQPYVNDNWQYRFARVRQGQDLQDILLQQALRGAAGGGTGGERR